ncbi:MAG: 6-pyruvoyl-tetrahydropterin synthase-related protein [Anaerolineae bacterium]
MSEGVKKTLANLDAGLILVLLLLTFAVSPLLRSGLPSMADVPIHLYRLVELDRCWQDGVYYPRWAPTLAFGYGYPLFNFAPPLPYFIAELFHVLGADFETAIKLLAVLCFLLYGLGMYLFAREVLGAKPALLAAAAYVYTPFRFREALIYGGNYPQILAMALYPWILWAFHRIIVEDRPKYIVAGALSYASLMLSHNFHALVFTPLLLAYAVYLMWTTKKWSRAREAGLALALGLGLSAFFWVPVLHDMRWTPARADFYISHTDFHRRFLSPRDLVAWPVPLDTSADNPYLPFSLGAAIVVLAGISLAALAVDTGYQVWKRWIRRSRPVARPLADSSFRPSTRSGRSPLRSDRALRLFASDSSADTFVKWHLLFFALVLAASVFMMLPASAPIWENVPFLPIGEFPWRLMGIANLASAFLAGASLCFWSARWSDRGAVSKALLALVVSLVIVVLSVAVYFYPTKPFIEYDNPSLQDYFRYELSTQTMGTTVIGEYMPVWARQTPTTSPLMPAYLAGQPVEKLNREDLPGSVQAQLVEHTVVSDRYRFTSDQPFTAHFYTFYFPAWRAYLDGQPTEIQITDPFALIAVPVPAGEHELLLRFENLPLWTAMNTLSAIALLAVLAIWVLYRGRGARLGHLAPDGAFSRNQALLLGGVLLLLLLVKVLLVDPQTTWFRRHSPVGQVIGVQHPARVNLDDKILFLGYDLISGDTVRQGEDLHVRLYWLALEPLDVNYSSFLHLDAPPDYVTWATSDNLHPGDPQALTDVPSSNWWTSTYVRDEHRLEVPSDIPPVQYLLRVGLYDQGTGERLMVLANDGSVIGDSITLQPVRVIRAKPVSPRRLPHRVEYTLGAQIELLGYDLAIEDWELTLYWRAKAVMENDYTVFVHLVDQRGKLWGQGDSVPMRGMYPTSAWLPGQLVEDRHVIQIDSIVPPGSYRMLVGMYDPVTLERLQAVGPEGPVLSEAEGPLPEGAITLTQMGIGN